jgi:hypothetical protein
MMLVLGSALLALIALVIIVCFSPIVGRLYISRENQSNDEILVEVKSLYGLLRLRYEIPMIEFHGFKEGFVFKKEASGKGPTSTLMKGIEKIGKEQIIRFFKETRYLLQHTMQLKKWLKQTLSYIHVSEFRWKTQVGFGDAPWTALSTGMIWGIKGWLCGWLLNKMKLDAVPELNVVPQFNRAGYSTQITIVAQMRVGRLLFVLMLLAFRIFKARDGFKAWYRIFFKPDKSPAQSPV